MPQNIIAGKKGLVIKADDTVFDFELKITPQQAAGNALATAVQRPAGPWAAQRESSWKRALEMVLFNKPESFTQLLPTIKVLIDGHSKTLCN